MEARVVEEGIIFARDLGLGEVIVEGDASIVMSTLSKPDHTPSSIQKIMKGVKTWFCSPFACRHACNVSVSVIWVEDTPPMFADQICMDVLSMGVSPK